MGEYSIVLATIPSSPSITAATRINTSAFFIASSLTLVSTSIIAVKPNKALQIESKSGIFISFKILSEFMVLFFSVPILFPFFSLWISVPQINETI